MPHPSACTHAYTRVYTHVVFTHACPHSYAHTFQHIYTHYIYMHVPAHVGRWCGPLARGRHESLRRSPTSSRHRAHRYQSAYIVMAPVPIGSLSASPTACLLHGYIFLSTVPVLQMTGLGPDRFQRACSFQTPNGMPVRHVHRHVCTASRPV